MKKWLSLLAAVLALCLLPVYAMAEITYDPSTNTYTVSGNQNFDGTFDFSEASKSLRRIVFESGSSLKAIHYAHYIYNTDGYYPLEMIMNGSTITGHDNHVILSNGALTITGYGNNTITGGLKDAIHCRRDVTIEAIDGTISIEVQNIDNEESAPCAIRTHKNVYLGGGVTVVGGVNEDDGKAESAIEAEKIFVKAAPGMGVNVYVGNSAGDCWLVQGRPFADGMDITSLVHDPKKEDAGGLLPLHSHRERTAGFRCSRRSR